MSKYIVGLDIGTTKIACFVGMKSQNGKYSIVGFGKTDSVGVERGVVRNIRSTAESIRKAVDEASGMAKFAITDVYVGIAGQHIKSRTNQGSVMIADGQRQIEQSDVDRLIDDQRHIMLEPGEEIVHVFPQNYIVDNTPLDSDIDPVGVSGKCLAANFHIVTGNTSNLRNIHDAVKDAGLNILGVVLEPIASALAVLDNNEKAAGVALVDIGGGTTDIAIFQDSIIRHTSVLPIAGNVITEDIRKDCKILKRQAESLKTRFGSCLPNMVNQDDIISIPGIRNQAPREISVQTLAKIIKARTQIILEQVQYEINSSGYDGELLAGVVLTGGGAKLNNIKEFAEFTIGIDTRIGNADDHIDKQSSITIDNLGHPMYATGIGLVIYGVMQTEEKERLNSIQNSKKQGDTATTENETPNEQKDQPASNDSAIVTPEPKPEEPMKTKGDKDGKHPNFLKVVTEFLSSIFNDDGIDE